MRSEREQEIHQVVAAAAGLGGGHMVDSTDAGIVVAIPSGDGFKTYMVTAELIDQT